MGITSGTLSNVLSDLMYRAAIVLVRNLQLLNVIQCLMEFLALTTVGHGKLSNVAPCALSVGEFPTATVVSNLVSVKVWAVPWSTKIL